MTLDIYIPNRSEVTEDFYGDCDVLADITPLAVEHQFNDCIAMITIDPIVNSNYSFTPETLAYVRQLNQMNDLTKKYLQSLNLETDMDLFSRLSNLAVVGKNPTKNTLVSLSLIRQLRGRGMIVTVIEAENENNYYEQLCLELGGEYQKFADGLHQSANPLLVLNIGKSTNINYEKKQGLCPICEILEERVNLGIESKEIRGYLIVDKILPPTGKFLSFFNNPYNQLSGAIADDINFLYRNGNDMGVCNIWIAQTLKYMMKTRTHHVINMDFEGDRFISEWLIDDSK